VPFGQINACGEKREAGKRGKLRSYEAGKLWLWGDHGESPLQSM